MNRQVLEIDAALRHLQREDPGFMALIKRHGPPSWKPTKNSFASLGRAIIHQQLSGKAANTIYRRFLALHGGRFPTPRTLAVAKADDLRAAGLSRAKASYLIDLAKHYDSGAIRGRDFARQDNAEISASLCRVRGIGQWSVDMFLIFGLNRPDVLPVGDLGVRKGMQRHFTRRDLPSGPEMIELARPWQPFRSVASWYMWRLLEDDFATS